MSSCAPEACFEETNAYLKATFSLDATKKNTAPDSLTLYGITKPEDKIYDKEKGVQPALIPLNASADTSTFIIRINGVTDTVQFVYSSYPHLISRECGYTIYHYLDTFFHTTYSIDYIYLVNNSITNRDEENIRIYY